MKETPTLGVRMKLLILTATVTLLACAACKTMSESQTASAKGYSKTFEGVFRVYEEDSVATVKYSLKTTLLSKAYLNAHLVQNDIGPLISEVRHTILKLQNAIRPTYSKDDTTFILRSDEKAVESIVYQGRKADLIKRK
jgi:hypothetical protein